jgi:putative transposase
MAGDQVFVTTTVLDFVHAFDRSDIKDEMVRFTLLHCRRQEAKLHAFVVMSHHVHFLATLRESQAVSPFVSIYKRNATSLIRPMLSQQKERDFDMQRGLNGNSFWQRSFRSLVVSTSATFWQKVNYIHFNPVRSSLVMEPPEYKWSSSWMHQEGLWDEVKGLPLTADWHP